MLSYAIDWIIIGIVVYTIGRLSVTPPSDHPVALFFGVILLWPITVIRFLAVLVQVIRVLARKHGIRH